jgi:hypothetical protein
MRVVFWGGQTSAGIVVEHDGGRICHVTRHPPRNAADDAALVEAAAGADLLIFPGDWEEGIALKRRAGAKLLALGPNAGAGDLDGLSEALARKSSNVFLARQKMSFEL